MTPALEKRLLQVVVALACLVPIAAGGGGALYGGPFMYIPTLGNADSQFRYLSGLLLGIGFGFASTVPGIERHTARFRLLTFIVFVGGFARLLGVSITGMPPHAMQAALVMELAVTPLLCLWQGRVARRLA